MKALDLPGENPGCDICQHLGLKLVQDAMCDVPTVTGAWAYLCAAHKVTYGVLDQSLGTKITWTG